MNFNKTGENTRRLEQMLRVARNRMHRGGRTRTGRRLFEGTRPLLPSDYHIEIKRILTLLGRTDEVYEMERKRKELGNREIKSAIPLELIPAFGRFMSEQMDISTTKNPDGTYTHVFR